MSKQIVQGCASCRFGFYAREYWRPQVPVPLYQCRRYPPANGGSYHGEYQTPPIVRGDDWCGEWADRDNPEYDAHVAAQREKVKALRRSERPDLSGGD
jgi:hypothetical protein